MTQVMVDLETLGTSSTAVIIAIGAVEFDQKSGKLGREFYRVVDGQSCVDAGMKMDVSTVMWWMKQDTTARAAFEVKGVPLKDALGDLAEWLPEAASVWGNGATFDNVILSSAYRAVSLEQPWPFWGDRCYRTLKNLRPDVKFAREGTYHNALDDAKSQARHAIALLNALEA
jgi:hypothetical protein